MEKEGQNTPILLGEMLTKRVFEFRLLEYESDPENPMDLIPVITRARNLSEDSLELIVNGTTYVFSHDYTFFSSNDLVGGYIELKSSGEILFAFQTEHSHEESSEYWNRVKSVDIFVVGSWIDDFRMVYQQAEKRAAAERS